MAAVVPILEGNCVYDVGDGYYVAQFGYDNANAITVTLPAGGMINGFDPSPADRGQPSDFSPGRHEFVFDVGFAGWVSPVVTWTLNGNLAVASRDAVCVEFGAGLRPEP